VRFTNSYCYTTAGCYMRCCITANTTHNVHDTASQRAASHAQTASRVESYTLHFSSARRKCLYTTKLTVLHTVRHKQCASPGIDPRVDAPLLRYLIGKQSPPSTAASCTVPHGNFLDPLDQTPGGRHVTQHPVIIQTLV
jgi:hypothetical protein